MASSSSYHQAQPIPAIDRLVSVLVYLIPFLNGLKYGTYLFHKYPILELPFNFSYTITGILQSNSCFGNGDHGSGS
ncbi:hypothetical protein MKX03_003170 [Papaver bracteatum]|nr:hypothetical protein MKX03_003170 [Papaver bracteatum]